jgi:hypothetical protein
MSINKLQSIVQQTTSVEKKEKRKIRKKNKKANHTTKVCGRE